LPIVPVTIIGAHEAFPDDGTLLIYPRVIKVLIGDPIETKDIPLEEAEHLKKRIYRTIYDTLVEEIDRKKSAAQP
jgi:1-acyl-sn-glycerol-3-phosphate acyltransferase